MDQQYPIYHWANDDNPVSALEKTAQLRTTPCNILEWEMFTSLVPASLSGQNLLDYGCGVGELSLLCARRGATVLGVDRSEAVIQTARHQAKVNLMNLMDMDRCRFEVHTEMPVVGRYDLIVAKDVIEHIRDDDMWLASVAAILKPQGLLILSTQNNRCLNYLIEATYHRWWQGDKSWMGWDPTHVRFYNASSLSRLLTRHGFTVEKWASIWIIPYNIMSWLTLLKCDVTLPSLGHFDRWFGKMPPFNRLGWCLMAVCTRNK